MDEGKGFGFWKTIPIRFRRSTTSQSGSRIFLVPKRIRPSILTFSTRSLNRSKQRRRVDFPHPDGPISAVTRFFGIEIDMS